MDYPLCSIVTTQTRYLPIFLCCAYLCAACLQSYMYADADGVVLPFVVCSTCALRLRGEKEVPYRGAIAI